jgi:L-lactate dehydrogenase complex protein LldG
LRRRGRNTIVLPIDFPAELEPHGLQLLHDEDLSNDRIANADGVLTLCAAAIAETGTIVLDHGAGQGRRALTLLPDYHLCLVEAARIVGVVPEAVTRTEAAVKAGRPLTFISGPSATSDIELNRVEGVHGPRTLDVLILI